jgi:hypothetical protein
MFVRSVKVGLPKLDNTYKITALSHVVAMLFRHVQLKKHCRIPKVCYCCKHCFTNILPTRLLKLFKFTAVPFILLRICWIVLPIISCWKLTQTSLIVLFNDALNYKDYIASMMNEIWLRSISVMVPRSKVVVLWENVAQYPIVYHKSRRSIPGMEHGPPRWEVSDWSPKSWFVAMFI